MIFLEVEKWKAALLMSDLYIMLDYWPCRVKSENTRGLIPGTHVHKIVQ